MEEESKIYIGNLDYGVTEEDLKAVLTEKGFQAKEVTVIKDKYTNRSKGFGFAKFDTEEEVDKAIEALNGVELKSRSMNVSKARKKTESKFNGRRENGSGGGFRQRREF